MTANDTRITAEEVAKRLRAAFVCEMGTELAFRTGEIKGTGKGAAEVAMRVLRSLNILPAED